MPEDALHNTLARTAGPPTVLIVSDSHLGSTPVASIRLLGAVLLVLMTFVPIPDIG